MQALMAIQQIIGKRIVFDCTETIDSATLGFAIAIGRAAIRCSKTISSLTIKVAPCTRAELLVLHYVPKAARSSNGSAETGAHERALWRRLARRGR